LGEIDCLVFTGGVGEHSPRLRGDALAGLERFGIELDPVANESARPGENVISPPSADVTVLVVATNEELAMARAAVALLAS
jgi:acetate kinase